MKNKFDLYKSASDAAAGTLAMTPFETAAAGLATFQREKQAGEDWEFWFGVFTERREFFLALKGQKAPSEGALQGEGTGQ